MEKWPLVRRHHNMLAATKPPINGPIDKGGGEGNDGRGGGRGGGRGSGGGGTTAGGGKGRSKNGGGPFDLFNISPTRGFSSYKYEPSGTIGNDIDNYAAGGGNSSFDAANGEWTVADTGVYLIMFSGFPEGGKSSGERNQRLITGGSSPAGYATRDFASYNGSGSSANFASLIDVTASTVYTIDQQNSDLGENVHFSAVYLPSTEIAGEFRALKSAASGSAGAVITTYNTESFDPDSDFNATTGVYTAGATGIYMFTACAFPNAGTDALHGITYMVNGSSSGLSLYEDLLSTGTMGKRPAALVLLSLTSGDTVSLRQDGLAHSGVNFSGCQIASPTAYFSARKATATGASGATIAGWTEDFDVGANFNATTGVFTAPAAGTWVLSFYGHNDGSATDETQIAVALNGAVIDVAAREFISAKNHTANHALSLTIRLRAGDTIELRQESDAMANCYFAGFLVDW